VAAGNAPGLLARQPIVASCRLGRYARGRLEDVRDSDRFVLLYICCFFHYTCFYHIQHGVMFVHALET